MITMNLAEELVLVDFLKNIFVCFLGNNQIENLSVVVNIVIISPFSKELKF